MTPPLHALLRLHPRRLLVAPRVEVTAAARGRAEVVVHGLVCGVCVARTQAALRAVPGVIEARVDLDAGCATLTLTPGARADAGAMQRALERVVIGMPVRRAMQRWHERLVTVLRAIRPRFAEGRSG